MPKLKAFSGDKSKVAQNGNLSLIGWKNTKSRTYFQNVSHTAS